MLPNVERQTLMHCPTAGPTSVQPTAHPAITASHATHSNVLQFVFSHCTLHPPLQLQQNMLHFPLPQQPKLGLRLQQAFADVGWKNATIITASTITVKYGPDLFIIVCMRTHPHLELVVCPQRVTWIGCLNIRTTLKNPSRRVFTLYFFYNSKSILCLVAMYCLYCSPIVNKDLSWNNQN